MAILKKRKTFLGGFLHLNFLHSFTFSWVLLGVLTMMFMAWKVAEGDRRLHGSARFGRLQKVTEGGAWLGSVRKVAEGD